jgi:hypothetical protein
MQNTLKVRVTGPLMKFDNDWSIDVNRKQFAADPMQVFEVGNTPFWRKLIFDGLLVLIGEMDTRKESPPAEAPAKKTRNRK